MLGVDNKASTGSFELKALTTLYCYIGLINETEASTVNIIHHQL